MFVFRERTTLRRWLPDRVAFMTCVFSDLIGSEYKKFVMGIKKYKMNPLLLEYGKGELPSHGRSRKLWNVDVDRLYVPIWVNRNHWIGVCISFINRHIEVFDCGGKKKIKEVEAFTYLILRIVKAVQPLRMQKHLNVTSYTVSYVPMRGLNKANRHRMSLAWVGSFIDDDNIKEARIRIMWDLCEAATDPELIERMSKYESPNYKPAECIEL
ncbi:LOW QUALITY PROTEIN: hypothetical protein N665_0406s0015 [Sinapis alba]|nr:LOW QUALITY PROTEIN: hypothetical protein N665_0406s0015 [Sinapis alba]